VIDCLRAGKLSHYLYLYLYLSYVILHLHKNASRANFLALNEITVSYTCDSGHCKTYRDTGSKGSTGSHHIGLLIGFSGRDRARVRVRVRALGFRDRVRVYG